MHKLWVVVLSAIIFISILFGCSNAPHTANLNSQHPEISDLKNQEQSLQDEIDRLKKQIENTDDTDKIEDLEDDIEDLEDQLRGNRNIQIEIESNPFCNRTQNVYLEIMNQIKKQNIKPDLTSCTEVTPFIITQVAGELDLSQQLNSLQSGDLNYLREITSLDLSNNNLNSLPVDIFNTLENLEDLKLDGNNFERLPIGIFDFLASRRNGNFFGFKPFRVDILDDQLYDVEEQCSVKQTELQLVVEFDPQNNQDEDHCEDVVDEIEDNDEPDSNDLLNCSIMVDYNGLDCNGLISEHSKIRNYISFFQNIEKPLLYDHFENKFKNTCYIDLDYYFYNLLKFSFDNHERENPATLCTDQSGISWPGDLTFY